MSGHPMVTVISARAACVVSIAALVMTASGCATPPTDPVARAAYDEANDPIEPFNRSMFDVNTTLDSHVLRPVAATYRDVVPDVLRVSLRDFLRNLRSPLIFAHDLLQGEPGRATITFERFLINSTVGIAGFIDLSGEYMNLPFHDEDAGQTLAVWGVPEGPYLVLPVLGPSNFRDAGGFVVDNVIDPVSLAMQAHGITYGPFARATLTALDLRSRNIDTLDDIERSSIDFYATLRSLYRQRRTEDIGNGRKRGKDEGPGVPTRLAGDVDEIAPPHRDATKAGEIVPSQPVAAAPAGSAAGMDLASRAPENQAQALPEPMATPQAIEPLVETARIANGQAQADESATGTQESHAAVSMVNPSLRGAIITFGDGSATLSGSDRRVLKSVAAVALATGARILVAGRANDHAASADPISARFFNFDISGERADAVANELLLQGVSPGQMIVESSDERGAVYGITASGWQAAGRSVEVILQ